MCDEVARAAGGRGFVRNFAGETDLRAFIDMTAACRRVSDQRFGCDACRFGLGHSVGDYFRAN